jgi:hypothetical protein
MRANCGPTAARSREHRRTLVGHRLESWGCSGIGDRSMPLSPIPDAHRGTLGACKVRPERHRSRAPSCRRSRLRPHRESPRCLRGAEWPCQSRTLRGGRVPGPGSPPAPCLTRRSGSRPRSTGQASRQDAARPRRRLPTVSREGARRNHKAAHRERAARFCLPMPQALATLLPIEQAGTRYGQPGRHDTHRITRC